MSTERKPIPGYEGKYEIDTDGNVYAMTAYRNLPAGRVMKGRPNKDGYIYVAFYHNRKHSGHYVHRLVMLVFQPIENAHLFEVNHEDGNKANNRFENLKWVTHQANIEHARTVLKGWGKHRGESIGGSKFNPDIVREIRRLHTDGKTNLQIARLYNVSTMAIWKIIQRRSWAHVE